MANVHVVDLDDYVKAWASQLDGITRTNSTQSVTFKVDWSRVNVATENPTYKSARQTSPQSVILFKSRFDNDSSEQQEHSFSAQSKYTASSSVSLHQYFTLDGRTKVDLSLPEEVLKATSGFGQKLGVTSAGTQTFEKEQTWNVNTKIFVPEKQSRTAQQSISETKYSAPFSVDTVISGKVHVTKYAANGSFVGSVEPKDIAEIVQRFEVPTFVKTKGRTVRIRSTGQCDLTYAIEQHVTVSSNQRCGLGIRAMSNTYQFGY